MSYPTTHRAVTVVEQGKVSIQEKQLPALEEENILVRVRSVALNPADWKYIDWFLQPGSSTGADFAGDIIALGEKAKGSGLKVGDVVGGTVYFKNDNGSFQEYLVSRPEAVFRIGGVPYPDGATYGIAMSTAALALYWAFKTPFHGLSGPEPLLIWAGSTGVGMYAIKLAALAGYRVVTTCSPHNFDLVRSLGASAVFDYKDPSAPEKIKTWVNDQGFGPLRKGLDNISEKGSLEIVASCFADGQGELAVLLDPKEFKSTLKVIHVQGWDIWDFTSSGHKVIREFYDRIPKLIEQGDLREGTVPLLVWPRGLEGIPDAIDFIRQGKASGQKVVVNIV